MDSDVFGSDGRGRLSSEMLGFSADARVLIVNLDDFGMYPAINLAVVRCIEEGIGSSCSLMTPCPGAQHALQLLHQHPQISFGIHLTLFCDTPDNRWGPIASKDKVTSLLDGAGELFGPNQVPQLLAQARIDEVELEFRAQIAIVNDAELSPTHLDWHCLADGGRPDVFDLTTALAREHGLAMRVWLPPARNQLRRSGLPVVDHEFLDSFRLDLDGKAARFARLLRDLPIGLSEWAVHPGLGDETSRAIDPGWRVRRGDFEFLMSPQAREIASQEKIAVIDYRAVRQLWRQRCSRS